MMSTDARSDSGGRALSARGLGSSSLPQVGDLHTDSAVTLKGDLHTDSAVTLVGDLHTDSAVTLVRDLHLSLIHI